MDDFQFRKLEDWVPVGGLETASEQAYRLLRLEFIKAAMQGLCTKAAPDYSTGQCNAAIAERAVAVADATLAVAGEKGA